MKISTPARQKDRRRVSFTEAPGLFLEYLYKDLLSKLESVDRKVDKQTSRLDGLESKVNKGFLQSETRLAKLGTSQTWLIRILGVALPALLLLITYLHSDTKQVMQKLDSRINKMETKIDSRIDKINSRIDKMDSRIDKIDSRIDKINSRIDKIDSRIDKIDSSMDKMDSKLDLLLQRQSKTSRR